MTTTRAVWLFILALTAVRLSILATTDLAFDEAHYWMWSERLAPAYFSKGPGVAFAIRASTAIFGANEFGVRFWSPVLGAGTSLLLFYFARRLFSANAGLWTVLALNVTPIFNVGSFIMTIDPLSIFFWTAAMFTFWIATERSPNFSWYWPATGLLIGLGFLCKYTNALQLISVLLGSRTRSAFAARIQAAWLIRVARPVRRLHDPADRLEFAARLDHAGAFAIAWKSRSGFRISPIRAADVSRPTFSRLFTFAFCGPGLGRHPQLAAG